MSTSNLLETIAPKSLLVWSVKEQASVHCEHGSVHDGKDTPLCTSLTSTGKRQLAKAARQNYQQLQSPLCSICAGHLHNAVAAMTEYTDRCTLWQLGQNANSFCLRNTSHSHRQDVWAERCLEIGSLVTKPHYLQPPLQPWPPARPRQHQVNDFCFQNYYWFLPTSVAGRAEQNSE